MSANKATVDVSELVDVVNRTLVRVANEIDARDIAGGLADDPMGSMLIEDMREAGERIGFSEDDIQVFYVGVVLMRSMLSTFKSLAWMVLSDPSRFMQSDEGVSDPVRELLKDCGRMAARRDI